MDFWQTLDSAQNLVISKTFGSSYGSPGSPGLPLAVDQQVVEQEEDALLNVPGGDLQQVAVVEQLRADVRQVGPLGTSWREEPQSETSHGSASRSRSLNPLGMLTASATQPCGGRRVGSELWSYAPSNSPSHSTHF